MLDRAILHKGGTGRLFLWIYQLTIAASAPSHVASKTTLWIILAVSAGHLINDVMQSLL